MLPLWKDAGWGWAMWNFRGGFGVLDSNRKDVKYEDFMGHKLDRKMLEILKEF
jgi:endoglucanase